MKYFRAPWSASLVFVSVLATALVAGVCIAASRDTHGVVPVLGFLGLGVAALFTVRGYTILNDTILVHRLFWATRLPRGPVQAAVCDPKLLRWSLRLFGNGGLYAFTGLYRNSRLGAYRAFMTDPRRAVILKYPDRTIVLSPESPQDFVRELASAA